MKFKIDTKEKFHVITLQEPSLSANMTEDFKELLLPFLKLIPKNVILNFENVHNIDNDFANTLSDVQQTFYDDNTSLVFCNINAGIETLLDEMELLEVMNITPTESEAWDIVQMEEIERELL